MSDTKPGAQYPVFLAFKLSEAQAQAVRRAARQDDRSLSGYIRRVLMAAVQAAPSPSAAPVEHDR